MSAAHRYVDVRNTTASKERLMVMLFETALRHMRTAARHLENKDRKTAAPLLEKACQIVLELQSTLKPDLLTPKLAESLIEIYTFTAGKLCRANITGDVKDVRHAERAFAPIVDGFAQAVAALGPNGAATNSGANPRANANANVAGLTAAPAMSPAAPAGRADGGPGQAARSASAAGASPTGHGGAGPAGGTSAIATAGSTGGGMKNAIAGRYARITR